MIAVFERELRDLAQVPRWSIIRTIKTQSVAEHCYYTAIYAEQIAHRLEIEVDKSRLLHTALWHDMEECFTSDIPGPIKHAVCKPFPYSQFVHKGLEDRFGTMEADKHRLQNTTIEQIVKTASTIDELFFLAGEMAMGNHQLQKQFMRSLKKADKEWREVAKNASTLNEEEQEEVWQSVLKRLHQEKEGQSLGI